MVFPLFSNFVPSNICMPKPEVIPTPTRPVENVVLTTKGLQERNIQILDGTTVENKGKTINILLVVCYYY